MKITGKAPRRASRPKPQGEIRSGAQVRSYVLTPHQLVVDHRTGAKVADVQAVLDGELELIWDGAVARI